MKCFTSKYYTFIGLAFLMLVLFSCHKGGEPVPYNGVNSSSNSTSYTSSLRLGDGSSDEGDSTNVNGIITNPLLGEGDDSGTVIGGDDNEDDDDLDAGAGGASGLGGGTTTGDIIPGSDHVGGGV